MRFEWSYFRDFIIGYLLNIVVVAIAIFSAITGLAYIITEFGFGKDLPNGYWFSIWITIVIAGVLFAQGIVYFRIAKRIIPGERIEECLTRIAELREEGVNELRNYKANINTDNDFEDFRGKFLEWHRRLIPEIEKVSPSQASIFKVLGTVTYRVPTGGFKSVLEAKVAHLIGIITEYNERLKDMVDKFSLENLSNRVKK